MSRVLLILIGLIGVVTLYTYAYYTLFVNQKSLRKHSAEDLQSCSFCFSSSSYSSLNWYIAWLVSFVVHLSSSSSFWNCEWITRIVFFVVIVRSTFYFLESNSAVCWRSLRTSRTESETNVIHYKLSETLGQLIISDITMIIPLLHIQTHKIYG